MVAFYVFCAVVVVALLALLALLLRPETARPMTVWSLAALMPLLAALAAALGHQAQAKAALERYYPQSRAFVIETAGKEYDLTLTPRLAACLERTLRLGVNMNLKLPGEKSVPLRRSTKVTGYLPKQAYTEALAIQGQLNCPEFRHVAAKKK